MNKKEWKTYKKRNIKQYVLNKIFGIHFLLIPPIKQKKLKYKLLYKLEYFRHIFMFKVFNYIYIPQVEYAITNICTLKCRDCINYIPTIEKEYHQTISFDKFRIHLDNLLKPVKKLDTLILIGGEPLLNKELKQCLEYSASNKKISKVFIISNGTIIPSQEVLDILKKYRNKCYYMISNYTGNSKLKNRIKDKEIIEILKNNKINYKFEENLSWLKVSPIKYFGRTKQENETYYEQCLNPCVAIMDAKLAACPRISVFLQRKIYPTDKEYFISLEKECSKQEFIQFYSRKYFEGCNYCNVLKDKEVTKPAIQIGDSDD